MPGEKAATKEERKGPWRKRMDPHGYLDPMANVIQAAKVEGSSVVGCERGEALGGDDLLARGQLLDSS